MAPEHGAERLRVAIVAQAAAEPGWAAQFAGADIDVTEVATVNEALALSGLALILAAPADAAEIVARTGESGGPAVTVMVGSPGEAHPHARLMRALLEGKNQWERTFDAIVDPIVLLDPKGDVLRANVGFGRAVGRPVDQIVGHHYRVLIGVIPGCPIEASLADGMARTRETRFPRLSGVQQVTTSAFSNRSGTGLVVILKDVSERREQDERIMLASRLADIGQLAAGVAHEINTPLASIALRAESLLKSSEDQRLQAIDSFKNFPRYLKTIDEEIFRCKKIIAGLLDFSRVRKPEVRDTDLNALAERAADLVGHQMKLKQVSLILGLEPGLAHVQADDGQLRQALVALLMNALDACSAGGRVEIGTLGGTGDVTLYVIDDGAGIPPEALDKIFNPFFTTKPVGQGTGLGLAICHGIVTSHGGEIRVESEPGQGTRVSFKLPTATAAAS